MNLKQKIIIVGNGPSLLKSKMGGKIDQFENIVRFNNFKIKGYEQNVGTKITIWSKWYAIPLNKEAIHSKLIWLNIPLADRTSEKIKIGIDSVKELSCKVEIIPELNVIFKLQSQMFGTISHKWPSSGILAIEHALSKNYEVSIAGMDSWQNEPFHYYEVHNRSRTRHVEQLEREYISELNQKGILEILK